MLSSHRETKDRRNQAVIEAIKVRRGERRELRTIGLGRPAKRGRDRRQIVPEKDRMTLARRAGRVRAGGVASVVKEVEAASAAFRRALCQAE